MKKQIEWFPPGDSSDDFACGDMHYSLDDLKAKFDVREIDGGWLVVAQHETVPGSGWMRFAVMSFAVSEVGGANTRVDCVFHGEGPGGKNHSLRECRHTYWGEDGYIFYPNGKLISSALEALREFYDLD